MVVVHCWWVHFGLICVTGWVGRLFCRVATVRRVFWLLLSPWRMDFLNWSLIIVLSDLKNLWHCFVNSCRPTIFLQADLEQIRWTNVAVSSVYVHTFSRETCLTFQVRGEPCGIWHKFADWLVRTISEENLLRDFVGDLEQLWCPYKRHTLLVHKCKQFLLGLIADWRAWETLRIETFSHFLSLFYSI